MTVETTCTCKNCGQPVTVVRQSRFRKQDLLYYRCGNCGTSDTTVDHTPKDRVMIV